MFADGLYPRLGYEMQEHARAYSVVTIHILIALQFVVLDSLLYFVVVWIHRRSYLVGTKIYGMPAYRRFARSELRSGSVACQCICVKIYKKLTGQNASLAIHVRTVEYADVLISVRNSRVKRRDAMLRVSAEKVTG